MKKLLFILFPLLFFGLISEAALTKVSSSMMTSTGVTPGAYSSANITVDSAGRISLAANGSGGGGSFASSDLSNVFVTSIPGVLKPSAPASSDFATAALPWKEGFFNKITGRNTGGTVTNIYMASTPESGSIGVTAPTVKSLESGGLNFISTSLSGYLTIESANYFYLKALRAYIESDFYAAITNTFDIGKSTNQFKDLHLNGDVVRGGVKVISGSSRDLWDSGGVAALGFGFNDYVYLAQTGDGESKKLRWFEASGANYVQFGAPNSLSVDSSYTFPTSTPATVGQFLTSNPSGDMSWTSAGTVTSVATGTGLTGGPITSTGTISLASTAVNAGSYGSSSDVSVFTVDAQGRLTAATSTPVFIPVSKLAQTGATTGQVIKWTGSTWAASTDSTGGGGGSSALSAKYKTASGQTISNNTVTIIDFGTSEFDSLTSGSISTGGSWKYTANSNVEIQITALVTFNYPTLFTANQVITMYVYKNGSFYEYLDIAKTQGATDIYQKSGTTKIRLVNTDFIDIRILQQTGVSQSLLGAAEANRVIITEMGSY